MDIDYVRPSGDPGYAAQSVSYTGTAGSTSGWAPGAKGVLVWATTDAYIVVGDAVTATTSDCPIPAGTPVILHVPRGVGNPFRVSAIQISSGGTVYAKPVS